MSAIAMLSQSCQVYYKTAVSVEKATNAPEAQRIKAKLKNGKVFYFRSIYEQNGHLFGRTTKKGDYVLFAIVETLESPRLQNKALSNAGNGLIIIGVITLIMLFEVNQEFGLWF